MGWNVVSRFFLDLHWWVYLCIVFSVFSVCLVLNYIVKKVNEAKLEERFARLAAKPRSQATEIQGNTDLEANRRNLVSSAARARTPPESRKHEPLATNSLPEVKASASAKVSQNAAVIKKEPSNVSKKKSAELLISLKDSKAISSFDKIEEDIGPSNKQSVVENTGSKHSRTVLNTDGAVTVTTSNPSNNHMPSSHQSKIVEPQQQPSQRSLVDWIKDWLVPSVSKDDLHPKSSSHSHK